MLGAASSASHSARRALTAFPKSADALASWLASSTRTGAFRGLPSNPRRAKSADWAKPQNKQLLALRNTRPPTGLGGWRGELQGLQRPVTLSVYPDAPGDPVRFGDGEARRQERPRR